MCVRCKGKSTFPRRKWLSLLESGKRKGKWCEREKKTEKEILKFCVREPTFPLSLFDRTSLWWRGKSLSHFPTFPLSVGPGLKQRLKPSRVWEGVFWKTVVSTKTAHIKFYRTLRYCPDSGIGTFLCSFLWPQSTYGVSEVICRLHNI